MEAKGNVLLKSEFLSTKIWPNPQFTLNGMIDLESEYKNSLSGKMCLVLDVAVDESSYLVLGHSDRVGDFLWMIDKEDTKGFIPVINKNGIIMPAGLSPIEEFNWIAKHYTNINHD